MGKRERVLAGIVLLLGAGFVFLQFGFGPWSEAMAQADQDLTHARKELRAAKDKAEREPEVTKEWKGLKDRLVKSEEASNALVGFVDKLIRKHDLKKASLSPEAAVPLQGNAAFRDHPMAFTFQCPWEAFVKLMFDFHTAEEFVRIQKLTVQSHYLVETEKWLDVTLRLTTVSAAPAGAGK